MKLENLGEYIVPVVIMVLYFLLTGIKKTKKPPVHAHQKKREPPAALKQPHKQLQPKPKSPAPVPEKILLSTPKTALKKISRSEKLLKKQSLRNAFLIKEILNRPYD